jgi:putative glutamine amidotransferase
MAVVALSMRVVFAEAYAEPRDAISHDWTTWLEEQGHTPLLVPNALASPADFLRAFRPDALVLTGGNDAVAPTAQAEGGAHGSAAGSATGSSVSPDRDRTERALLAAAVDGGLPVLGVCRGMHVVNQYFGGAVRPGDCGARHAGTVHRVRLSPPFDALAGSERLDVNSYHRQWVPLDGMAPGLTRVAVDDVDGVVEALAHQVHPVLAVQWHPERRGAGEPLGRRLLARLLAGGAFWAGR